MIMTIHVLKTKHIQRKKYVNILSCERHAFYLHFLQEIAQETCYNRPSTAPRAESVTVMVPSPSMDCGPATLTLPTVACEDITEEKSVAVQFAFRCRHVCFD